jgi:F-box protein 18 (helicase)
MELTEEQKEIIDYNLEKNSVLKIIAFAGTGKTTTLVEYAKARPHTRFLYISFNKSVQIEAASKFPKNVTCKTAHSLAWWGFGNKHKDRLVPSFKANTVKDVLDLDSYEDGKFTIDTLINYLVSADPKVSKRHIPHTARQHYEYLKEAEMPNFVDLANRLGRLMCDGSDDQIGMLHDGYLKLYQLSKPLLKYDVIFLDEAQDINPVIAEIALKQNAGRIIVGDSHQQIYSFRGARDMMRKVKASKTLYLTNSFRFDNNIARVANMILQTFKDEDNKVVGLKKKTKSTFSKGYTVIARTNAAIFSEAAKLYVKNKIAFVGGISGYRFERIVDVYYLDSNKKDNIKDPYIRCFHDFEDLKDYAKATEDWEIMGVCRVVEEYGKRIPKLVEKITDAAVDMNKAKILLTTGHKAKGLEWANVHITSDFPDLVEDGEIIETSSLEPDEFNLIYVAVTRSMGGLRFQPGSSIADFIIEAKKQTKEKVVGQ